MIRWTKPVKFVFLLPAVFWVLAFTVFPLGYSLYISFHDVDRKVVVTGREKVPVLNEAGEPVLKKSGEPRTKTVGAPRASDQFHLERLRQLSSAPSATRRWALR